MWNVHDHILEIDFNATLEDFGEVVTQKDNLKAHFALGHKFPAKFVQSFK